MRQALLIALIVAGHCAPAAQAQQSDPPNGVFLVAKPGLRDANFSRSVVLVTQTKDGNTVGVIVNRPTDLKLQQFLPEGQSGEGYRDAVYFGGPVMQPALVALFRSDETPRHPSFHVLKGLYLSMHPANIEALLKSGDRRYRMYAGFSGWAPHQLESELARDGWYVLPADADAVFRADSGGLWQELIDRATSPRAGEDFGAAKAVLHK